MATSSGDDVPAQLAALLGKGEVRIRKTDDKPPQVSVIDVAVLITGKDANKAAQDVATVKDHFPDVTQNLGHVTFPDSRGRKGQKDTPVAGVNVLSGQRVRDFSLTRIFRVWQVWAQPA